MSKLLKLFISFYVLSCKIIYCFGQTSKHEDREIRTIDSGENNQLGVEFPDAKPLTNFDELHNLCVATDPLAEQSAKDEDENFVSTRRDRDRLRSSSTSRKSNDTSLLFSNHFLSCKRIGVSPNLFEVRENGTIYLQKLSVTFDESEFCKDETGVFFICDEKLEDSGQGHEVQPSTYSYLSEKLLNCSNHITIKKGSFNSTSDQSVYLPEYDIIVHYSDYLIGLNGELLMCPVTNPEDPSSAFSHLSSEFLNCSGHVAIENGSFEIRPDRSVYVPAYGRVFDYSNHLIGKKGELFICPEFYPKRKFSGHFEVFTVLGLSISILFIILYMGFFAFIESLRNLPGYCLFSLCVALLMGYACFLIRSIGPEKDLCRDLAMSTMYFFLASFFWMNVLSFDVWRSLKMATSKLRLSSNTMLWKRFGLYSLYAWSFPLAILIFGIIVTKHWSSVHFFQLEFNEEYCWFDKKAALFAYLALPLIILMCLNAIFFTTSFVMITRASMNSTDNMATFWKRFFLFLKLAVIMGVAWIFWNYSCSNGPDGAVLHLRYTQYFARGFHLLQFRPH